MKTKRQDEYQAAEDAIEAMSRCLGKLQKLDQSDETACFFVREVEADLQEAAANLINGYLKARVIKALVDHGIQPDLDFDNDLDSSGGKVINISVGKPN
jgi:hypothetical protein